MPPVGILFGVLAAAFWGVGDFLITLLTRRIGTRWALVSIQVLSLAAWILLLFGSSKPPMISPALWGILLATAVCHVLGLAFVYRAFEVGNLAIVSPISAAFAIVTAVLSLLSGERPPGLVLAGSALLVAGVTLATRGPTSENAGRTSFRGVPEALASAVAFGTMFWLFYFYVQPRLGYVIPLVSLKALAVCGSALAVVLSRPAGGARGTKPTSTVLLLAVGAAAADTLAWLTYIEGTHTDYATVVTALASLFSAVTVLLAWRFFHERLAVHQWVGVAVILVGILLVSV
jgi:drug/metabolite transporter (DMT)-like permease